jgi:hypothetical protein
MHRAASDYVYPELLRAFVTDDVEVSTPDASFLTDIAKADPAPVRTKSPRVQRPELERLRGFLRATVPAPIRLFGYKTRSLLRPFTRG